MNIKFAAYGIAALLIGFAVMMLPLALETGPPTYKPDLNPFAYTSSEAEGRNDQGSQLDNADGLASQPPTTSSSVILLTGLVIAFAAYVFFKRQLGQRPKTFS